MLGDYFNEGNLMAKKQKISSSRAVCLGLVVAASLTSSYGTAQNIVWEKSKSGVRLSSIDMDDVRFDDTIGIGGYTEVPVFESVRVGVSLDYWSTEERLVDVNKLRDVAISAYGKYVLKPVGSSLTPYAMAGVGMHFVKLDRFEEAPDHSRKGSLDLGVGVEAEITPYVAMTAEMRLRNLDRHDYTDYAVGAIAKF